MNNKITNSPITKVITVILTALVLIYGAWIVSNTFQAYEIVSSNYDTFNYPNTIKVHSGTFKQTEMMDLFVCKVSAENAYGQRSYNSFLASKDGMTSFEWYDENDIPILSSTKKRANQSNVSETLLNFFDLEGLGVTMKNLTFFIDIISAIGWALVGILRVKLYIEFRDSSEIMFAFVHFCCATFFTVLAFSIL